MIRVDIFEEMRSIDLEERIENFINFGTPKKIHDIKFSTAVRNENYIVFSAMVIYEELEVKDE